MFNSQSAAHPGDFSCSLHRPSENQNLRVTTAQIFILKCHFYIVVVDIAKAPFSRQGHSTARNKKKNTVSDCSSRYHRTVETQWVRLRATETTQTNLFPVGRNNANIAQFDGQFIA